MNKEQKIKLQVKFLHLRVIEGKSFQSIGKELKIDKKTAINWSTELSIDITNLKASVKQELIEKFKLTYKEKLSFQCDLYNKVKQSITTKNIDQLSVDKKFQLLQQLEKEIFAGNNLFHSDIAESINSDMDDIFPSSKNKTVDID